MPKAKKTAKPAAAPAAPADPFEGCVIREKIRSGRYKPEYRGAGKKLPILGDKPVPMWSHIVHLIGKEQ